MADWPLMIRAAASIRANVAVVYIGPDIDGDMI